MLDPQLSLQVGRDSMLSPLFLLIYYIIPQHNTLTPTATSPSFAPHIFGAFFILSQPSYCRDLNVRVMTLLV